MIVYFVRHASAGQRKNDPVKDEKRALDDSGVEQCSLVGRSLAAMDAHVDAVVSSPLKRASQTASLVANELGHEGRLILDDALRPEATFAQFRELLGRHERAEAIMVVGHNPNLSEFLGRLLGGASAESAFDLKKGAVAKVEADRRGALLHWVLTPKLARAVQESLASASRPKKKTK
ncbi:MAG TPA: phosphohistidine phosphatase SixA [Terriglobales bacterium]|nr:phosphohistidine phosphatase SixA [Terriglobales bacterium]